MSDRPQPDPRPPFARDIEASREEVEVIHRPGDCRFCDELRKGVHRDISAARIPRRSPEEHEAKLTRSASYVWRLMAIAVVLAVLAGLMRACGVA